MVEPGYTTVDYDYSTYAEPTTQVSPYEDDYVHIPTRPMATYEHRAAPVSDMRDVAGWERDFLDRSRLYHEDFNEYDKEDWDTDLWKQQTLKYGLDDERDALEGDMSLMQDAERAQNDQWWETYRKATTEEELEYGSGHGKSNGPAYGYEDDFGYGLYTKVDVRETLLHANELWNADVLSVRQQWRTDLASERQAHRDAVAMIVANYDTEVAEIKAAMLAARASKRADVAAINGNLRADVSSMIAKSHADVADENTGHNALVLEMLEAVDYYGSHADIVTLLDSAGEGDIDIFGSADLRAFHLKRQNDVYRSDEAPASYWGHPSSGYY